MRIVLVWAVAITLIFTISLGWYISQPVVVGIARGLNSTYTTQNQRNISTTIEYVSYLWGPLFIIFILLWAVINSQREDVESQYYR